MVKIDCGEFQHSPPSEHRRPDFRSWLQQAGFSRTRLGPEKENWLSAVRGLTSPPGTSDRHRLFAEWHRLDRRYACEGSNPASRPLDQSASDQAACEGAP